MTPGVLVLNAGSSSVKFAAFALRRQTLVVDALFRGQISGVGREPGFQVSLGDGTKRQQELDASTVANHRAAIDHILEWVKSQDLGLKWVGVGHRIVHGGSRAQAAMVDAALIDELERLSPLAPHHQPHNLAAIRAVAEIAPSLPQVACFDTAFHTTQPEVARMLPLPAVYRDQGLMRYGFHGLSYEYIVSALPRIARAPLPSRLVVAHLGNGASLCAIRDGRSVATSMGFSTLDGLLMGTRCGSIDPGAILHLLDQCGLDTSALTDLLYNHCGLLGVSGISADMRVLLDSNDPRAERAVEFFCYRLVRGIGSMAAALGGLDALVFTGGIGEHSASVRARVCAASKWLGIELDQEANEQAASKLSQPCSRVAVWTVAANEELTIARQVQDVLGART